MSIDQMFLAIDDNNPLGIFWANAEGCDVMDLDLFLEDSKIDMSRNLAARYAERFQRFVDDLREYSGASPGPTHYAVIDEHGEIVQAFKVANYRNAEFLCKTLIKFMGENDHDTSEWTVKGVTIHD